jgi:ABC-type multidrug transport system fused ATPase/permease subunit
VVVAVKKNSSLVLIIIEFLTRYTWQFMVLFSLLVIEGGVAALSVASLVPLADFMLDQTLEKTTKITHLVIIFFSSIGIPPAFWTFGILFVGSNILKSFLEIAIRYAILRIKYAITKGLFGDALQTFFRSRWEFFSDAEQGLLLNTLNRELNTISDALGRLATLLAQLIQLGIYLAVPLWLNAKLTLTAIGLALLFGLPFMLLHKVSYRLGQINAATANIALGTLNEVIASARLMLGFGRQDQARERFLAAFNRHINATLRSQVLDTTIIKLFQPLAILAIVIALGIAVQQNAPVPELAAVMWSLLVAMPILSSLLQGNISISNLLPSYEQLVSLREKAKKLEEVQGDLIFKSFNREIELRNISFNYPGRTNTLDGVNIKIAKGQMTALVGKSGSGKSTLTDLVLGLQIANKGYLLIDGIPLAKWNINSFRRVVGYVPQDPQLFHASIRENLLWSHEAATEEDLWRSLDMANASTFVKNLPQGMDTIVGDRGARLSGGQRQRIALARALIRSPELLILDEATSALDSESEKLIQESIDRVASDTTILIVAHRLTTIKKADQIYVLENGKVVEEGPFSFLSNMPDGIFQEMLFSQSSLTDEMGVARVVENKE